MPPSAAPALAVHSLQKRYGGIEALKGVDLEVQKGELVGLLGPNGAGKSTLVKIACGLVRPSGGTASIKGDPPSSPRARRSLGYLAELFRFPGWYSAAELLARSMPCSSLGESLVPALGRMRADGHRPPAPRL